MTATLPTRNAEYGFYGSITTTPLRDRTSDACWELATTRIAIATDCKSDTEMEGVRDFLDSRMGRHFGDEMVGRMSRGASIEHALNATIDQWCKWTIGSKTEREEGIPASMPMLYGWVHHFAICAEAEDDAA